VPTSEDVGESRRFASDRSNGVIHEIVAYDARRQSYTSVCGLSLSARTCEVYRDREPGVICKACRTAMASPVI
jgi:hypothetical protein